VEPLGPGHAVCPAIGDVVLDAFCGSGTTLHAAQDLGRSWIGIDKSPVACRIVADRLTTKCQLREGLDFAVRDLPKSVHELREYSPLDFENWAVNALNTVLATNSAMAGKAHIESRESDSVIYSASGGKEGRSKALRDPNSNLYPVQVKQKDRASRLDVRSFETAIRHHMRKKGFLVSYGFTPEALDEVKRIREEQGVEIIPLTVTEILNEQRRHKVADGGVTNRDEEDIGGDGGTES
jgi:SAM-dependent methyltransferase